MLGLNLIAAAAHLLTARQRHRLSNRVAVQETVEPILDMYKPPGLIKKIYFRRLTFGNAPIRIDNVWVDKQTPEELILEVCRSEGLSPEKLIDPQHHAPRSPSRRQTCDLSIALYQPVVPGHPWHPTPRCLALHTTHDCCACVIVTKPCACSDRSPSSHV